MDYKWYEKVEGDKITQGDIIIDCPVYKPLEVFDEEGEKKKVKGEILIIDAVIMTQACDIENGKVKDIILCPLIDVIKANIGKNKLSEVKKGAQPGYHLISKSDVPDFEMGYKLVEFINLYSLSLEAIKKMVNGKGQRLRLLPPYREHLSQAFARYFMRVGLPYDIDIKDIQEEKKNVES